MDGPTVNTPVDGHARNYKGCQTLQWNLLNQIELERLRLSLLLDCSTIKRPPQSLRLCGISGIRACQRLKLISKWESEALALAILNKKEDLAHLKKRLNSLSKDEQSLLFPIDDVRISRTKTNFGKKVNWFEQQNDSKWKSWPDKVHVNRTEKRKMKRRKRKQRKKAFDIQKKAQEALDSNSVVVLVETPIVPPEAIVVLAKGDGWIPSPSHNQFQCRKDGYNAANKLAWSTIHKDNTRSSTLPQKLLKKEVTASAPPSKDVVVNSVVEEIKNFVDNSIHCEPRRNNMTPEERNGLTWLKDNVKTGEIAVTKADKGGSLCIVKPDLLEKITMEKLNNPDLYVNLGTESPVKGISQELLRLWSYAIEKDFLSHSIAKQVVGLTENHRPSTLDRFKPGEAYHYPLLKLHKLKPDQIKPGIVPPCRLVTALDQSPTVRSDTYLDAEHLAPLSRDFCHDLVKDSTEVLQWLDLAETQQLISNSTLFYNIDVKSLYDSLEEDLVNEAVKSAITHCRQDWKEDFIKWLFDLIALNNRSAVAKHGDVWYRQSKGRATGDVLSVDLGNMAVFYAFDKVIYSQPSQIIKMMRFVDDGCGAYDGVESPFIPVMGQTFINELSFIYFFRYINMQLTERYGLELTYNLYKPGEFCEFLDIRFRFDNGTLFTDLYRKPTDSDGFLHFSSVHPPHMFASVVYSQVVRYRRIINSDDVLEVRLKELYNRFVKCSYPKKMLDDIFCKVKNMPRNIQYSDKEEEKTADVYWVSNFDPGHKAVKEFTDKVNTSLKQSPVWKEDAQKSPIVKVVPRRSPNVKDLLFKRRTLAHNIKPEGKASSRCTDPGVKKKGRKCMQCLLMSGRSYITQNDVNYPCHGGNCQTMNIIYVASCKLCLYKMKYVGKTVQQLRERVNKHRNVFKSFNPSDNIEITDKEALAAHAKSYHDLSTVTEFNKCYSWDIYRNVHNPDLLLTEEQKHINELNTIYPFGLNISNPIGLKSFLIYRV